MNKFEIKIRKIVALIVSFFIYDKKLRKNIRSLIKYDGKIFIHTEDGKEKRVWSVKGTNIKFSGYNARIDFYLPIFEMKDCVFHLGENSKFKISSTIHAVRKLKVFGFSPNATRIDIDEDFSTDGLSIIFERNRANSLKIGKDCMFSNQIKIRYTDSHVILDKQTGERINYGPEEIVIGNHVWIGERVTILKGCTKIPSNSIIGMESVVTKSFEEENTIIGGFPAKVLKRNIDWDRELT